MIYNIEQKKVVNACKYEQIIFARTFDNCIINISNSQLLKYFTEIKMLEVLEELKNGRIIEIK